MLPPVDLRPFCGSRASAADVRAALHLHADPLVHGAADCLSKSAPDEMAIEAGFLVMEEEVKAAEAEARKVSKFSPVHKSKPLNDCFDADYDG